MLFHPSTLLVQEPRPQSLFVQLFLILKSQFVSLSNLACPSQTRASSSQVLSLCLCGPCIYSCYITDHIAVSPLVYLPVFSTFCKFLKTGSTS